MVRFRIEHVADVVIGVNDPVSSLFLCRNSRLSLADSGEVHYCASWACGEGFTYNAEMQETECTNNACTDHQCCKGEQ